VLRFLGTKHPKITLKKKIEHFLFINIKTVQKWYALSGLSTCGHVNLMTPETLVSSLNMARHSVLKNTIMHAKELLCIRALSYCLPPLAKELPKQNALKYLKQFGHTQPGINPGVHKFSQTLKDFQAVGLPQTGVLDRALTWKLMKLKTFWHS